MDHPWNRMMEKVHDSWYRFLVKYELMDPLKATLDEILDNYDEKEITPTIENIMYWARFPLEDTKIVICGQDPYFSLDKSKNRIAHGLAFSTLDVHVCPPSLKQIFHAIKRDKLVDKIPEVYDLSNWSKQGVLLLNASSTTIIGKSLKHKENWKSVNEKIFKSIAEHFMVEATPLVYMLWGKDAQKRAAYIPSIHHIMKTAHPSPQAQMRLKDNNAKKFTNCRHFVKANALLEEWNRKPIIWDTVINHVIYTDGSCKLKPSGAIPQGYKANKDSVASWAYYISDGTFRDESNSGAVKIKQCPRLMNGKKTEYTVYPTSIRGEGIAIIKALAHICNNSILFTGTITIKTDCKHWADGFNNWKWMRNDANHDKLKNLDIIQTLQQFAKRIDEDIGELEVVFISAAHDIPRPEDEDTEEYRDWLFNSKVDQMAKAVWKK